MTAYFPGSSLAEQDGMWTIGVINLNKWLGDKYDIDEIE